VLATAWGPVHGGINVFNQDLVRALDEHADIDMSCLVLEPIDREALAPNDVSVRQVTSFDAKAVLAVLGTDFLARVAWVIGHDDKTGSSAIALARQLPAAKAAIIHHMNLVAYKSLQGDSDSQVYDRWKGQQALLQSAEAVFAVGPKLVRSASDLLGDGRVVTELVPGLRIRDRRPPRHYTAIAAGRLDPKADRVKLGSAAVEAFLQACMNSPSELGRDPKLIVVGTDPADRARFEEAAADRLRWANTILVKYTRDREEMDSLVRCASAALVLSFHEGFGLTAWEAIGCGVPLVLTANAGVYDFVEREFGDAGLACLKSVNVDLTGSGEPTKATVDAVERALLEIARDSARANRNADTLRQMIVAKDFSWRKCILTITERLGFEMALPSDDAAAVADLHYRDGWIATDDGEGEACAIITVLCPLRDEVLAELQALHDSFARDPYAPVEEPARKAEWQRRLLECIAQLPIDIYAAIYNGAAEDAAVRWLVEGRQRAKRYRIRDLRAATPEVLRVWAMPSEGPNNALADALSIIARAIRDSFRDEQVITSPALHRIALKVRLVGDLRFNRFFKSRDIPTSY
jgi:glycosyltransferase involved in cell wall biosynthesis